MSAYEPRPIDTSAIVLPAELAELVERLAENTHEVWALLRIDQGWQWGPARDDVEKRHPCLVAYDDLPESEKEYDRRTAVEVIKVILALGFSLGRKESS